MKVKKGSKWRWVLDDGTFFTKGRVYRVLSTGKPGEMFKLEDDNRTSDSPHHWTNDESFFASFERVEGPVRTVKRKRIAYGVFGSVLVNETASGGSLASVEVTKVRKPAEIRAAAATLIEIADALESETPA